MSDYTEVNVLRNLRVQESAEHPGEVTIYAEDAHGHTVYGVIARDALADVFQATVLDARVTRRLANHHLAKFGRVLLDKYQKRPDSFEASVLHTHQFGAVLTLQDFRASGESFTHAEFLAAVEETLDDQ